MRRLVPLLLLPAVSLGCSVEVNVGEGATGGLTDGELPELPAPPDPLGPPETSTGGDDGPLPAPSLDLPDDGGCDPLDPYACPGDATCQPLLEGSTIEGFECQDPGDGPKGTYAEPCACKFCCDAGFMCAPQAAVGPACTTGTCCTPLCDVNVPDCPAVGQQCVPLSTGSDPELSNLGVCRIVG